MYITKLLRFLLAIINEYEVHLFLKKISRNERLTYKIG